MEMEDEALRPTRERLLLRGVDLAPTQDYAEVLRLERVAIEDGYPTIDAL
jgi:hypothetical protein